MSEKSRSKFSVRQKLFLYLALFTAFILILLWLTQVLFLPDIYKTIKLSEIKISARALADRIGSPTFREDAESYILRGDMCVLVLKMLDENKALEVLSLDTLPNCMIHNTDRASKFTLYDMAKRNGGELLRHYRYDTDARVYYSVEDDGYDRAENEIIVYAIIRQIKGERYLFLLNSIITPVAATTRTLNLLLMFISVILLGLAILFATIISRSITTPIININESAKQLAKGDYDVSFKGSGYREISELAETLNHTAAELGKVDALRRELIANISHDLRTPLTMIRGYAEVMRDIPGENTPENEQIIIDETNRLASLVNDMLDISRYQSGNYAVEIKETNITKAVSELLARYNSFAERDGYFIAFHYDDELIMHTDASKIIQALYNLVNNAITYSGDDKLVTVCQYVTIGAGGLPSTVKFTVTDTGEGIPKDKLVHIWDRYYKVDKVHRRASVGSGLGLSIVKNIAGLLGGSCGVESEEGKGSTFWIEFPVYYTPPFADDMNAN
ncbi:MAG: HAMP domain-containing histidine kinase [Clostridiales bacterium]|nr:HAMP domain-containing histidine kinase [Clostridiales bacterium]